MLVHFPANYSRHLIDQKETVSQVNNHRNGDEKETNVSVNLCKRFIPYERFVCKCHNT